jgi:hypothetical protein
MPVGRVMKRLYHDKVIIKMLGDCQKDLVPMLACGGNREKIVGAVGKMLPVTGSIPVHGMGSRLIGRIPQAL